MLAARIIFCGVLLAGCWHITRPVELQRQRKWKVPASVVLFWIVSDVFNLVVVPGGAINGDTVRPALAAFLISVMVWRENLAHLAAGKATNALFGDGHGGGGFRTTYRDARVCLQGDDFDGALRAVKEQLKKEPMDFEGLSMLVEIYGQTGESDLALDQIELILRQATPTPEQKTWALNAQQQLRIQKLRLEDEARRRR